MQMINTRYLTSRQLLLATVVLLAASACSDKNDAPMAPTRVLTTVNVSVGAGAIEVGEITGATAVGLDQDGAPITVGAVTWSSETPTIAAVNPATGFIFALAPGSTTISAMTSDGKVGERTLVVKTAPAIRINEVQPKADTPNGWVEFFNPTADAVDLSGWTLIDNNFFGPQYTFPAGSIIQPGGFLVTEETALPFGVDATDDLHLVQPIRHQRRCGDLEWSACDDGGSLSGWCGRVRRDSGAHERHPERVSLVFETARTAADGRGLRLLASRC